MASVGDVPRRSPTAARCFDPREYVRGQRWLPADHTQTSSHEYLPPARSTDLDEHVRFLRWISESGRVEVGRGVESPSRLLDRYRYWATRPFVGPLPGLPFFCVLHRRPASDGGEPAEPP